MNKKLLFLIITIVIIAIGSGFFILKQNNKSTKDSVQTNSTEVATTKDTSIPEQSSNIPDTKKASYVAYDSNLVNTTKGVKILFFHAPWCPQCKELDSDISKNISSDTNVTIFKVDYDSNQSLRQKYGVTIQTTLVKIDDNGNLIEKYVAYQEPTYANLKSNLY